MAGPLNPSAASNNLLAMVLKTAMKGRGDVGYVDTGEPTATTLTGTANVVQVNFPVNGVGQQPAVQSGAWGIIVAAVGTQTTVGAIVVEAVDTTVTNSGHAEVVDAIPALPATLGGCFVRPIAPSIGAGSDSSNGPLTNVIGLRLSIPLSGTSPTCTVQVVGVGNP
jgi:hypothetical protein